MEVEEKLLAAIDELAKDGPVGEIRFLAALLACRGKVERRQRGWQHPFDDFAEREGAAFQQELRGLVARGIVYRTRGDDIVLNSYIISRNKDFVCGRCANRLFIRAHHRFTQVLKEIRYDDLYDVACRRSRTSVNRAFRGMGARAREMEKAGLLVYSSRAQPQVFPALSWVSELPWAAAVALTLEQGHALTWKNCLNNSQMAFHLALAAGYITYDSEKQETQLTERGRELADGYIVHAMRKRLSWIGDVREETMHLMLDELTAPLPSVWIDGRGKRLDNTWHVDPTRPLRILLLKDRTLRMWFRRLVRRFEKLGLAQLIACRDGVDRYYFAPEAAAIAKDEFGLPAEPFALSREQQVPFSAYWHLATRLVEERGGIWRARPDFSSPDLAPGAAAMAEEVLQRLSTSKVVKGPDSDGAYRISDPDAFRWELVEALLDPVAAFYTTIPETEPFLEASVQA